MFNTNERFFLLRSRYRTNSLTWTETKEWHITRNAYNRLPQCEEEWKGLVKLNDGMFKYIFMILLVGIRIENLLGAATNCFRAQLWCSRIFTGFFFSAIHRIFGNPILCSGASASVRVCVCVLEIAGANFYCNSVQRICVRRGKMNAKLSTPKLLSTRTRIWFDKSAELHSLIDWPVAILTKGSIALWQINWHYRYYERVLQHSIRAYKSIASVTMTHII